MPRLFDPSIFDGPDIFDTRVRVTVFPTVPPTLDSELARSHTAVARLLFLEADAETVIHEVPAKLIAGTVTLDRGRDIHRQDSVQIANDDGLYASLTPASLVWPGRLVRVERGALVGGVPQYSPLITGVIGTPGGAEETAVVTFTIYGRLHLADRQFYTPLTIPAGTPIAAAVRTILQLAGLGSSDALYDLDDGGATTAASRTYDVAEKMLQSAITLAYDTGCDLYDSGAGVVLLRPWLEPTTLEPRWTFAPGVTATMTSLRREVHENVDVYNRAAAIGVGPDRYPIRAEARVTNPNDPLFWTTDNDRPRQPYPSPDITTQQMANTVARRRLFEGATYEEQLAAQAAENPLVEDRHAARFQGAGVDDVYLLDTVQHQVGLGEMGMTVRKIRSLIGAAE